MLRVARRRGLEIRPKPQSWAAPLIPWGILQPQKEWVAKGGVYQTGLTITAAPDLTGGYDDGGRGLIVGIRLVVRRRGPDVEP